MPMAHRLRRLERTIRVDAGGFRPCAACRNGERTFVTFTSDFMDMPPPRDTRCEACGREVGTIINFCRAVPPDWVRPPQITEPPP